MAFPQNKALLNFKGITFEHVQHKYSMVGVNIRHEELEEISSELIGNGVFGNYFLKRFNRLEITVVEKHWIDGTVDMLYKEQCLCKNFPTDVSHCYLASS